MDTEGWIGYKTVWSHYKDREQENEQEWSLLVVTTGITKLVHVHTCVLIVLQHGQLVLKPKKQKKKTSNSRNLEIQYAVKSINSSITENEILITTSSKNKGNCLKTRASYVLGKSIIYDWLMLLGFHVKHVSTGNCALVLGVPVWSRGSQSMVPKTGSSCLRTCLKFKF